MPSWSWDRQLQASAPRTAKNFAWPTCPVRLSFGIAVPTLVPVLPCPSPACLAPPDQCQGPGYDQDRLRRCPDQQDGGNPAGRRRRTPGRRLADQRHPGTDPPPEPDRARPQGHAGHGRPCTPAARSPTGTAPRAIASRLGGGLTGPARGCHGRFRIQPAEHPS